MRLFKFTLIFVLCTLVLVCGKSISLGKNVPGKTASLPGEQGEMTRAKKLRVVVLGPADSTPRIEKLKKAFAQDGFTEIKKIIKVNGYYGIRAENPNALNCDSKEPKMALYLEGDPYDMGFQTGYLAEPEVERMAVDFVETIAPSFVDPDLPIPIQKAIGKVIDKILLPDVRKLAASDAIPPEYNEQIAGVLMGCQKINPDTKVTLDGLDLLNYGQNVICAYVYHGQFFEQEGIKPSFLRHPMRCNAFSLSGEAVAGDQHFFGRDLMFVTGGVLQYTGCLMIYNPDTYYRKKKALPQVTYTAPGMVGSLAAMNTNGVAMGMDMFPSVTCDPDNPGIDSLIMVRHAVQYGRNADELVNLVKEAKRGVSWFFPFADGSSAKAGVLETIQSLDPGQFPSPEKLAQFFLDLALEKPESLPLEILMGRFISKLGEHLPGVDFIEQNMQQFENLRSGIFVRWSDYQYPTAYLDYDKNLWHYYNEMFWFLGYKHLHDDALTAEGMIDRVKENQEGFEKNCPASYYFAPQREDLDYDVLVSNGPIVPEFRLACMNYWTGALLNVSEEMDDIQWRYDELNRLILEAVKEGPVDETTARNLIDFLRPDGEFPFYYAHNPKCKDGKTVVINGSTNLFELKSKVMYSHFGYYSDPWVQITLPRYFD